MCFGTPADINVPIAKSQTLNQAGTTLKGVSAQIKLRRHKQHIQSVLTYIYIYKQKLNIEHQAIDFRSFSFKSASIPLWIMRLCENWLKRYREICKQIDLNVPAGLAKVQAAVFSESEFAECAFNLNFPLPRVHQALNVFVVGLNFLFCAGVVWSPRSICCSEATQASIFKGHCPAPDNQHYRGCYFYIMKICFWHKMLNNC